MSGRLRVMSYNVRGCLGLDGRESPERVAEVIASLEPDVVALQELFVHRDVDQPAIIAERLGMRVTFCETLVTPRGHYGHAVLSRHPLDGTCLSPLPGLAITEPRSALITTVEVDGVALGVVATHLSLEPIERRKQVRLLKAMADEAAGPFVLAGDLNLRPGSSGHAELSGSLRDAWHVQKKRPSRRPPTWPAPFPIFTFDYVFVSPGLVVESTWVPSGRTVAIASDHRPVVADLSL